jgi:hypothetical protein
MIRSDMNKFHIFILVSLVILTSGCTSQSLEQVASSSDFEKNYRYTFLIEEDLSLTESKETAQILESRLSNVDLKSGVEVTINESNPEELYIYTNGNEDQERLRLLVAPSGSFSAFLKLKVSDGEKISIGKNYTVKVEADKVTINGKDILEGESKEIGGTEIEVEAIDGEEASLKLIGYSNEDVEGIHSERSGLGYDGDRYRITLIVSVEAAERLKDIAQNYREKDGRLYREETPAKIHFYLDNEEISSPSISEGFQKQTIRYPTMSFTGESTEELRQRGEQIISALRSGNLDTPIEELKSSGYINNASNSSIKDEKGEERDSTSEESERSEKELIEIQDYEKPYGQGNYEEKIIWNASWMSGIVHIRLNRSDNQFDMINRYKGGGTRLNRTLQRQCLLTDLYAHSPKEIVLENYYNKKEFPIDILQNNEPRNVYFEYLSDSANQVIAFCEPNENIDPETSTGDYYYPSSEILIERNY